MYEALRTHYYFLSLSFLYYRSLREKKEKKEDNSRKLNISEKKKIINCMMWVHLVPGAFSANASRYVGESC